MIPPEGAAMRSQGKIFWSDSEKTRIISEAADIQNRRPDLSGLPLLRAAMAVMPPSRRRKVAALSQAPWFEPGITDEIKRREMEAKANANLAPLLKVNADANLTVAQTQAKILKLIEQRASLAAETYAKMVGLLEEILVELRSQREQCNGMPRHRQRRGSDPSSN